MTYVCIWPHVRIYADIRPRMLIYVRVYPHALIPSTYMHNWYYIATVRSTIRPVLPGVVHVETCLAYISIYLYAKNPVLLRTNIGK